MADISKLVLEVESKGINKTISELQKLNGVTSVTQKSSEVAKGSTKGFTSEILKSSAVMKTFQTAIKLVKSSFDAFADFEMVQANLQVVTGSVEEAKNQFADLRKLASETPFEVEGLANASIMLQQAGVSASEMTETLRMLGDVSGGNNEKFNRIAQNFAQIQSVGKASSMDMRQFAMAGLPVYDLMKKMGIQGNATADEVTQMFKEMTKEGGTFFNGMKLQSDTLNGKISTLKDTWKDFKATIIEETGLGETKKKTISFATNFLDIDSKSFKLWNEYFDISKQKNKDIVQVYEYNNSVIEYRKKLLKDILHLSDEQIANDKKIKQISEQQDLMENQYKMQKNILEVERQRVEENKRLLELEQKQSQDYESIFKSIEEEYFERSTSELQKVQKNINDLTDLLSAKKTVTSTIDEGWGKSVVRTTEVDAFTPEQKKVIQGLIDILALERNDLRDNTGAVKENTTKTSTWLKEKTGSETFDSYFDKLVEDSFTVILDKMGNVIDTNFNASKYAKGVAGQNLMGLTQGSDVGNFLEGMQKGGIWGGVINTLLSALTNVIGGIQGLNLILSPITEMLKELSPTIKALMIPALAISKVLVLVGKGLQWLLNILTFGLIDEMADSWDNLVNQSEELGENTKNVNENMKSLTQDLKELMDAIDKQEQYYIGEKMNIMAQNRYNTKVNDMILTPEGTFSTNPKDTIIATKNPEGLVGGKVSVQINNYGNNEVTARQDSNGKLIIDISKKIANDFATGSNGWGNAFSYRQQKESGRRLS